MKQVDKIRDRELELNNIELDTDKSGHLTVHDVVHEDTKDDVLNKHHRKLAKDAAIREMSQLIKDESELVKRVEKLTSARAELGDELKQLKIAKIRLQKVTVAKKGALSSSK